MEATEPKTGAAGAAPGTPWLIRRQRRPDAPVDLYCFTHAGGSPGEYVRWSDGLPGAQVWAVQLPGRASRRAEPPYTAMRPLVDALVEAVSFDRPFAFFGHSLGGLVAFEVARTLRDLGRRQPERLFLSSCPPPPLPLSGRGTPMHTLPDAELLAETERRWGPLPDAVRSHPELLTIVLSYTRSDVAVFETYAYVPGPPLDLPVTVFAGTEERDTFRFEDWANHTRGPVDLNFLPGGHFYLRAEQRELLRQVAGRLPGAVPGTGHAGPTDT
ncbi:thioesterase II family protein [Streptomyces sp. NPDC059096]|uniref:thioesterase II family protein n=1 Tax=unclassified Streptomyces TaxID=2593676 RepID=UPI003699E94C